MATPLDEMASQITGGLSDIKIDVMTVFLFIISIFLVLVALDLFKGFLVGSLDDYRNRREEEEAERLLTLKSDTSTSRFYKDVIDKKYRRLVNNRSMRKF